MYGQEELPVSFLGCGTFPGGWWCWALLCRGVALPEGRQARAGKAPEVVRFLQVVRPALWYGRQPQVRPVHGLGGEGMHWETLLAAGWQASALAVSQEVFYGGPPLLLCPPQHWCLVCPAGPALLSVSLCCGFPLPNPLHIALSTCDTLLPNPSGCLCTANPTNCFLVSQAVSTSPTFPGTNLQSQDLGA